MKSQRFNTPVTKSEAPQGALDDKRVTYDEKTGNIMYRDGDEAWELTALGHKHTSGNKLTMTGDGILLRADGDMAVGCVCFGPTDYPITIVKGYAGENSVSTHIRLMLGIQKQKNLIVTTEGRFFIVDGVPDRVPADCELDVIKLTQSAELMKNLDARVGTIGKLKSTKGTIVDALNEVIERVNCPRRLIGYAEYLIFSEDEIKKFEPHDLNLCFDYEKKRWMYYSAALEKWTYLPKGWQKLTNVTRFELDVVYEPAENLEVGETVGVMDTGKCYQWNGEHWDEIAEPVDEVGDEYIVQFALVNNELKSLTVVYTGRGWVYTLR